MEVKIYLNPQIAESYKALLNRVMIDEPFDLPKKKAVYVLNKEKMKCKKEKKNVRLYKI